jgi:hypothetical protein
VCAAGARWLERAGAHLSANDSRGEFGSTTLPTPGLRIEPPLREVRLDALATFVVSPCSSSESLMPEAPASYVRRPDAPPPRMAAAAAAAACAFFLQRRGGSTRITASTWYRSCVRSARRVPTCRGFDHTTTRAGGVGAGRRTNGLNGQWCLVDIAPALTLPLRGKTLAGRFAPVPLNNPPTEPAESVDSLARAAPA